MKKTLFFLLILIALFCLAKTAIATNIGVAQPNGTNIGIMQYEVTALAGGAKPQVIMISR